MLLLSLSMEKIGVCHFGWVIGKVSIWILESVGVLKPEPFSVGKAVEIQGLKVHDDDLEMMTRHASASPV